MRPMFSTDNLMADSLDRFALQPSDIDQLKRQVVQLRHAEPSVARPVKPAGPGAPCAQA